MEGLISQGHLRTDTISSRDHSSSVEPVPHPTSTHRESSTSKSKKKKMPSSAPGTPCDERAGPSKPQTWKDKPGMAKKRKRAHVKPGWEMIEVDDEDDEDVMSSGEIVSGPRPSTSGLKSKSNGQSSRRPVYDVDSSSQGGSSSESAQETDEDDYGMVKSQSSRKNSKKKGKQVERYKSPVSKKPKGKEGKAGKAVKKRALSQDPEIQEIALSSLDNSVFVIGMSVVSHLIIN